MDSWQASKMHCFIVIVILFTVVGCDRCPCHECMDGWDRQGWTENGKENQYCYRFFYTKKTMVDAEDFCQTFEAPNGEDTSHLASVHSQEEHEYLLSNWRKDRHNDPQVTFLGLWIGLNDIANEGDWRYTDGSKYDFRLWKDTEPNDCCGGEDAVHMLDNQHKTSDGGWNDIPHNNSWLFPFVCKMPIRNCN